jgi:hypothetical protein
MIGGKFGNGVATLVKVDVKAPRLDFLSFKAFVLNFIASKLLRP